MLMTNEEIRSVIEAAFVDKRCAVEIFDYDQKIRFRVFDKADQPIFSVTDIVIDSVRNREDLDRLLARTHLRIG